MIVNKIILLYIAFKYFRLQILRTNHKKRYVEIHRNYMGANISMLVKTLKLGIYKYIIKLI